MASDCIKALKFLGTPLTAAPSVKHKLSQLPAEPQLSSTVPQTVQAPRVHAVPQKHKEEETNIGDQQIQNLRQEVNRNVILNLTLA